MSTADYVVDVVGFAAGVLVASSLLAQIWRAHMLESAVDLSYLWQGTVAVGVLMQLIYLAHYEKWSVFVPLFSELLFMLYLLCLKVYFENHLFGFGRGGRDAEGGAPKLGELLLDGNNGFVPGGGNGPRAEAAGRSSGGGDGGGLLVRRMSDWRAGRPDALPPSRQSRVPTRRSKPDVGAERGTIGTRMMLDCRWRADEDGDGGAGRMDENFLTRCIASALSALNGTASVRRTRRGVHIAWLVVERYTTFARASQGAFGSGYTFYIGVVDVAVFSRVDAASERVSDREILRFPLLRWSQFFFPALFLDDKLVASSTGTRGRKSFVY